MLLGKVLPPFIRFPSVRAVIKYTFATVKHLNTLDMKCKYCNAEVQPNARFCTSCGGDLSKFDKCVNCGEFIDKGESTCPHCRTEQPQPVLSEKGGSKKWLLIIVIPGAVHQGLVRK